MMMVLHIIRDRVTAGIVMVILGAGGWKFCVDNVGGWSNDSAHGGGMMMRSHHEGTHVGSMLCCVLRDLYYVMLGVRVV